MTEEAAEGDPASAQAPRAAVPARPPDLNPHNVVIDCADHDVVVPFWQAMLGWEARRVNDQFVALRPPPGSGVSFAILFQKVPEPKVVKNRAHIDFDAGNMEAEVTRLVALGATVIAERNLGDFRWTVVADPEGNEFCVTIR
jgi:predicted enzyme related to lactoylglutathione lyase